MNNILKDSGLAETFEIRPMTLNKDLAQYLGKIVRYKEYSPKNGTITLEYDFLIKETQKDHSGKEVLRGYAVCRDTKEEIKSHSAQFGRVINPNEVKIIA